MAPVANRMTVDLALDALDLHLVQTLLEHLVARLARHHALQDNVLHPVRLFQARLEARQSVRLALGPAQDVRHVLYVGVHAHCGDPEIDVEEVAFADDVLGARPAGERLGRDHGHTRVVPSGDVEREHLFAVPPLDVLRDRHE